MAAGLSAVKLEKAIMNLETRLREDGPWGGGPLSEEFRKEVKRQVSKQIQPYVRKIDALQDKLSSVSHSMHPDSSGLELGKAAVPDGEIQDMVHVDMDALMGTEKAPVERKLRDHAQGYISETSVMPSQAIFSLELGDAADDKGANSASVGIEVEGAVREVAREVAQAATEHQRTLSVSSANDEVYDKLGSPVADAFSNEASASTLLDPDLVEEPVAFLETAWNLVLVLGHTNSGPIDLAIACFLWLFSGLMQISFFVILLSEDFLGEPFARQVEVARNWRETVAHDYKHMDLGDESLVSRVCRLDGTLIISTPQTALLDQINAFIGLGKGDLEAPYFQPGVLLCMMCILLWCLYLVNEFRLVIFSLEAMSQVPRGPKTLWAGRGGFKTISYGRFGMYCIMRLSRFFIAVGLLYAGVQWLAGTTSITELILNAVALSAVLQIDEMVFSALMPKKIQICIQDLEAIKVQYSKARSQTESVVLLVGMCLLMLWPWTYNVGPLSASMLEVKRQYCGGTQDFVVANNQIQNVMVGLETAPYNSTASTMFDSSIARFSVNRHIWHQPVGPSKLIKFAKDRGQFDEWRVETMGTRNYHDSLCMDWDNIYLTNATHELEDYYRQYFWSATYNAGFPDGARCEDMAHLCPLDEGRLMRHVCPRTCGCHEQYSNPILKVLGEGCSNTCFSERDIETRFTPCQDVDLNQSAELRKNWESFWDAYMPVVANRLGTSFLETESLSFLPDFLTHVKEVGCSGLKVVEQDPVARVRWCSGTTFFYSPLAYLCPQTCGCHIADPRPDFCPRSCEGCVDTDLPVDSGIANCAQAQALGLCQAMPKMAAVYCAATCGLCSSLPNNGTVVPQV